MLPPWYNKLDFGLGERLVDTSIIIASFYVNLS